MHLDALPLYTFHQLFTYILFSTNQTSVPALRALVLRHAAAEWQQFPPAVPSGRGVTEEYYCCDTIGTMGAEPMSRLMQHAVMRALEEQQVAKKSDNDAGGRPASTAAGTTAPRGTCALRFQRPRRPAAHEM